MSFSQEIKIFLFIVITTCCEASFAQAIPRVISLKAVRDGKAAHCDSNVQNGNLFGIKHLNLELISSIPEEFTHKSKIRATLIRCENGSYIKDPHPTRESYLTQKGNRVDVKYFNYSMLVIDQHDHILSETPLPDLEKQSQAEFETVLADDNSPMHVVYFSLRADKVVIYNGTEISREAIKFGEFVIILKHERMSQAFD